MSNNKKSKKDKNKCKRRPDFYNDQLGENAGEGRIKEHLAEKKK